MAKIQGCDGSLNFFRQFIARLNEQPRQDQLFSDTSGRVALQIFVVDFEYRLGKHEENHEKSTFYEKYCFLNEPLSKK